MIASAAGGAVAGALQVYCNAGWGGLVVLPVTSGLLYVLSLAIGVAVHVVLVRLIKKDVKEVKAGSENNISSDDIELEIEF